MNKLRKHGIQCGCRNEVSPAAGASLNQEYQDYYITKQACIKRGTNHPAALGGTIASDADNDAVYAAAIC